MADAVDVAVAADDDTADLYGLRVLRGPSTSPKNRVPLACQKLPFLCVVVILLLAPIYLVVGQGFVAVVASELALVLGQVRS